eukprot:gb/GFBE01030561.1/.p1 GENE.gb/GFBE01030561.1/~~gb/GFBE01030561.1/.p1  ORF type:complete len:227 (+),score=40.92 gb/GFBE01030561.1/:1-681(+)
MARKLPFDGDALHGCLSLWLALSPESMAEEEPNATAVREEARLILNLLEVIREVTASALEGMFSEGALDFHLVGALLAGGAAGNFDKPQMFSELYAAVEAGSIWAPLWLGDLEGLFAEEEGDEVGALCTAERRRWYLEAAVRGHPDAMQRLEPPPDDEDKPQRELLHFSADDLSKLALATRDGRNDFAMDDAPFLLDTVALQSSATEASDDSAWLTAIKSKRRSRL